MYGLEKPVDKNCVLKKFSTAEKLQWWIDQNPDIRRKLKIKKGKNND